MEAIVVMAFARLGNGNSLQMCGEVWHCIKYNIHYCKRILCSNEKELETISDT
jgi:hypothetical protein